jgi:type VI secretion system secreted protein VgrG
VSGALPVSELKQNLLVVLTSHAIGGTPVANMPYTLYKDGAEIDKGVTDELGQVLIKNHKEGTQKYKVKLFNGHEIELSVKPSLGTDDERLAVRGFQARQGKPEDRKRHQRHGQGSGVEGA